MPRLVFGQHLLAPVVAQFLADPPKARPQIILSERIVDLVEEGIDIAIRVASLPSSSMVRRRVMWAKASYFAREDVAQLIGRPADLAKADWLNADNEHGQTEWRLIRTGTPQEEHSFRKEPQITKTDVETLVLCAEAGLGVAILPDFVAPSVLVRVLPEYVARRVEINALTASHKSITPAVRIFLDYLEKHCSTWDRTA